VGNVVPYADSCVAASTVVLYFSTEYHNFRQNIIIPFHKYLVNIGIEAGKKIFLEYINGNYFAVHLRFISSKYF
jgi:hypothetical protein